MVSCLGLTAPPSGAALGRLRAPGPVGTVDTVAGPGFCDGAARHDATASRVGALAADSKGGLWFESGPMGQGLVTRVISTASIVVERTVPAPPSGRTATKGRTVPGTPAWAGGLAADGQGGVLVAHPRTVLRLGEGLSTLAGAPEGPESESGTAVGLDGPLAAARFADIAAVASDGAGNVFVADQAGGRSPTIAIRFLNRSDQPVTFYPGGPGEVIVPPASVATIVTDERRDGAAPPPRLAGKGAALAVGPGRLYLAVRVAGPRSPAVVRMLNLGTADLSAHGATVAPGAMATVATVEGARRAGPAGTSSPLPGIAADADGNLFLAEQARHVVRRVDPGGSTVTVAGTGSPGFNGNDRPAVQARLDRPYDVEVGAGGRIYIADAGNAQVRFVDQAGVIHAALGNGAADRWACAPGAAVSPDPRPGFPSGLAADASGNVYAAASAQGRVHRLTPSGTLRPVAGRPPDACTVPTSCPGPDGSDATTVELAELAAVAPGPGGGVYVQNGTRVLFVNLGRRPLTVHGVVVRPGAVGVVAGSGTELPDAGGRAPSDTDGGPALAASIAVDRTRFGSHGALALDRRGNLLIVEGPSHRVRQVDPHGTITTVAGGEPAPPGAATDVSRCCAYPTGVAVDRAGNAYITDLAGPGAGGRVWFLNRSDETVVSHGVKVAPRAAEVVAGGGSAAGGQEEGGPALQAQLRDPWGVVADDSGNLYVLDFTEHTVRRIDGRGTITTVVGTGQRGFSGDGLKGPATALDRPSAITLDACGNLLVADYGNDRVRRLNLVASCPTTSSASPSRPGRPALASIVALVAAVSMALAIGGVALRARRRSPSARGRRP